MYLRIAHDYIVEVPMTGFHFTGTAVSILPESRFPFHRIHGFLGAEFSMSDEEVKAMSWTTFVSGCTRPELVQYLKERRLYVNEPVCVEEEV